MALSKSEKKIVRLNTFELLNSSESNNKVPDSFKTGRDAQLQLSRVERDLFTDMEERESGNYIISGLPRKVTELDLTAYSFALGQLLYNQSYLTGNLKTNSGVSQTKSEALSETTGTIQLYGDVKTTLNDICKLAYGTDKPTTEQKRSMTKLIKTVHETPVKITYPSGDTTETYLCTIERRDKRKKDGAVLYWLHLNPIFCSNVQRNFSELPQDIISRLSKVAKRKTTAHYKLIRLLSCQSKSKPFSRKIDELVKELSLTEAYQKNKSRTAEQLLSVCEDMKNIDLIDKYDVCYSINGGKKSISKVTFYLCDRDKLLHHDKQKTIVLEEKDKLTADKKENRKKKNVVF